MMRLSEPQYTFENAIDECITGITGNVALRHKLRCCKFALAAVGIEYFIKAGAGELHTIPPISIHEDPAPVVINDLKKSELITIYDQYFVPEKSRAEKSMTRC